MSKFNYFNRINITTNNFVDAVASFDFITAGISLINEGTQANNIIEYSFNGADLHGDLNPNLPSAGLVFDNRHEDKVWFRLKASNVASIVRVEAWA